MNDIDKEGVYVWEDGSSITYNLGWGSGEPNNLGNEDCLTIRKGDGLYNDYKCETQDCHFICKTSYNKL